MNYLYGNQLLVTTPRKLTNCLVHIDYLANQFSGSNSDAIGRLKNLFILQLTEDEFSGPVPPS